MRVSCGASLRRSFVSNPAANAKTKLWEGIILTSRSAKAFRVPGYATIQHKLFSGNLSLLNEL